ncbi:hypothetical protein AVEN_212623-1 [Araneus ventricosus]|uniref:Uncharacterized protein n=1 Tax=Araneus ventricosus TaxID=182803 RepID=A0A4Y2LLB3_ARAVE|nr:hypothetical protein AVEN_212623-1 [Araneus ventricosus]
MLGSVGRAIGVHFQRCQAFHTHVQQLRIFEQRDPHLSQMESHKQDSSDVPKKSNQGTLNREIGVAKGLGHHAQYIASQKWNSGNCALMCRIPSFLTDPSPAVDPDPRIRFESET